MGRERTIRFRIVAKLGKKPSFSGKRFFAVKHQAKIIGSGKYVMLAAWIQTEGWYAPVAKTGKNRRADWESLYSMVGPYAGKYIPFD
jgi:hypothetical protein